MSYTSDRTSEINARTDQISATEIGGGITVSLYTDAHAYTVVKKTAKTMTLQEDDATLLNGQDLQFHPGGFVAHCSNQRIQEYSYKTNPKGPMIKITLRTWIDDEGNECRAWKRSGVKTNERGGNAFPGRHKFHDYNF